MELQTQLKSIADKITQLRDKIKTEESTKHAFILPFLSVFINSFTFYSLNNHPERPSNCFGYQQKIGKENEIICPEQMGENCITYTNTYLFM